jgi:hypothetical protein
MGTRDYWQPLSARIRSLSEAGQFAASLFRNSGEAGRTTVELEAHLAAIREDLLHFANALPKASNPNNSDEYARQAINRVSEAIRPLLQNGNATTDMRSMNVRTSLVLVAALEGEISYILRDSQETIRSRTERAFAHLNRSIMVDEDFRRRWVTAHATNEGACEKLGAIHLLLHGIWAFKAGKVGGETDLIYEEPLTEIAGIERISDGLVLTEWKLHRGNGDADNLFTDARNQAELYKSGTLGGTELTRYRYAVVVSKKEINVPGDYVVAECTYRHINIPVTPRTPSKR